METLKQNEYKIIPRFSGLFAFWKTGIFKQKEHKMEQRQKIKILARVLTGLLFLFSLDAVAESPNGIDSECKQAITTARYKKAINDFRSLYLLEESVFDLREGENLFIEETGLKVLNPLYYGNLTEMLYPVFKSNQRGLIAVSTVREAHRLMAFLNRAFTQMKFSPYYEGMAEEDKQKVIQAFQFSQTSYHAHYIVMVGGFDQLQTRKILSHLSAYIDLNGNITLLRKLYYTLLMYPGLPTSEVLFVLNLDLKIATKGEKMLDWPEIKKKISSSSRPFEEEMIDLGWQGQSEKTRKDLATTGALFIKTAKKNQFLSYEEAVWKLLPFGLRNRREYEKWQKNHPDMPAHPHQFYRGKGWKNWYIFLGTVKPVKLLSFERARLKARHAALSSEKKYHEWKKNHPDMPSNPNVVYADKGWIDWYDFLGNVEPEPKLPFEEARYKVRLLGLSSAENYYVWQKDHPDMPTNPDKFYAGKGWIDWYDFLGNVEPEPKLPFEEARYKVRSLGLSSKEQYYIWQKDHPDMPAHPDKTYKDTGWKNWYDFLGTPEPELKLPFERARLKAQLAQLPSRRKYEEWQKNHPDMPAHPDQFYRGKGWIDWRDFLGTLEPESKLPFERARLKAQLAQLPSRRKYEEWQKNHPDMPPKPDRFYAGKGWIDWYDFLGTVKRLPFERARLKAQLAQLPSKRKYKEWKKNHPDMPADPDITYAGKGWIDWDDFLGKTKPKAPFSEDVGQHTQTLTFH